MEHFFGIIRTRISKKQADRYNTIAKQFGAWFVHAGGEIPGNSDIHGWFACRNRGNPFNQDTERDVMRACGLR